MARFRPLSRLRADRRAAAALELALVFPAFVSFVFGLFAIYSLVTTRRALDYGIEKALRYAAVNSTGGGTSAQTVFTTAASVISPAVGSNATFMIGVNDATPSTTFASFVPGNKVTVSVSYVWGAPTKAPSTNGTALFGGFTMTAGASMRVVN